MSKEQEQRLAWLTRKEPNGLDESERIALENLRELLPKDECLDLPLPEPTSESD